MSLIEEQEKALQAKLSSLDGMFPFSFDAYQRVVLHLILL
jgi:hypothetical protein